MPINGIESKYYFGGEPDKDNLLKRFLAPRFLRRKETLPTISEVGVERVENFVINTYLGLDKTLKASGHRAIVDFNLSDRTNAPAVTINDAINRIQTTIDIIDNSVGQVGRDWHQTLRTELAGVAVYLTELQKPQVEQIGTTEAIREIMQADPRIISDDELRSDQYELAMFLNREKFINCTPEEPESMIRAFDRYKNKYYIRRPKTIEKRFHEAESRLKPAFIREIDPDLDKFRYMTDFIDKDEPYQAWAYRDRDGFHIDFNLSERNYWGHGEMDRYFLHEWGHLAMAYLHRRAIDNGEATRALAIMPIPGARQYVFEGVAQTIHRGFPDFFPNLQLSNVAKISIAEYRLRMKLRTNTLLKLDQGDDLGKVIDDYRQYYPMKTEEEVAEDIEKVRNDLFWKGYLPAYGIGDQEFSSMFKVIPTENRTEFLRKIFVTPMVRSQVIDSLADFNLKHRPVWLDSYTSK